MFKLDFLSYKIISRYLIIVAICLIAGAIIRNGIAIIFGMAILYFSVTKNLFRAIETFFIWFFISNFFIGQEYITSELISKYIAKPYFLLFVVFLFFLNKIPINLLKSGFLKVWVIFLTITLLSAITQGQSPFVIITASAFFIIYLLIQTKGINTDHLTKFLNLFIAIAIIQSIVSYLQVSELITAPVKMMDDGSGGQFEWEAGLDDVASGTFGPAASHITSWYAALISLYMLLMWTSTKNKNYLIILCITFLQYATVDSKIIMGVTILMLGYMLFYILKEKRMFRISFGRYFLFIIILIVGALGFLKAWNSYYEYYGKMSGGPRTDINSVYEDEGKESLKLVLENIGDWGKIKGYQYIFHDFIKDDPIQLIWGYGVQGYDINGKMSYIEDQDVPIMQLNNLTKSRSGLITLFATSGLLGFVLFMSSVFLWFKQNSQKTKKIQNTVATSLLRIYLPFSLLAAFLYAMDITSIPLITFAAIISIYIRISDSHKEYNKTSCKIEILNTP